MSGDDSIISALEMTVATIIFLALISTFIFFYNSSMEGNNVVAEKARENTTITDTQSPVNTNYMIYDGAISGVGVEQAIYDEYEQGRLVYLNGEYIPHSKIYEYKYDKYGNHAIFIDKILNGRSSLDIMKYVYKYDFNQNGEIVRVWFSDMTT